MSAKPSRDSRRLALIRTDDGVEVEASIVEAAPHGLSVVLSGGRSASLALGERVELEVDWSPGDPHLELHAFVRDLAQLDALVHCELEFDFEGAMGRNLTPETLKLIFNRRRSERVTIERAEQPVVRMTDDRTGAGVEGWVSDLSTGGLGLRLLLSDVPDLADTQRVRLAFTLPETSFELDLRVRLCNCRPQGAYVVLGFEFESDGPGSEVGERERDAIRGFVSRRLAVPVGR